MEHVVVICRNLFFNLEALEVAASGTVKTKVLYSIFNRADTSSYNCSAKFKKAFIIILPLPLVRAIITLEY